MKRAEFMIGAVVHESDERVTIFGKVGVKLQLLGASCDTSLGVWDRRGVWVDSFTVKASRIKEHVIAISARVRRDKKVSEFDEESFFLPVVFANETPFIHLSSETPWIPRFGRIGQIIDGDVIVRIGDKFYTTDWDNRARKGSGYRYIYQDGTDLLCKYLVGHAKESDVLSVALEEQQAPLKRAIASAKQAWKELGLTRKTLTEIIEISKGKGWRRFFQMRRVKRVLVDYNIQKEVLERKFK